MKFIVGIGNLGERYEKTRHNIGFEVLEAIRKKHGLLTKPKRLTQSLLVPFGPECYLVFPNTFVNNTGKAVEEIANGTSRAVREIVVLLNMNKARDFLFVCDDVNLAFGKLRLRESGSAGGHHGLESIIQSLGSDDFPRLRIGVGNDRMPKDLTAFVLEEFTAEEKKDLNKVLEKAVLVCEAWEKEGFGSAQGCLSRYQSAKGKGK